MALLFALGLMRNKTKSTFSWRVQAVSYQLPLRRAKMKLKLWNFNGGWGNCKICCHIHQWGFLLVQKCMWHILDIRYFLILRSVIRNTEAWKSEWSYKNAALKLLFIIPSICLEESKRNKETLSWFQEKAVPTATPNVVKRKSVWKSHKTSQLFLLKKWLNWSELNWLKIF